MFCLHICRRNSNPHTKSNIEIKIKSLHNEQHFLITTNFISYNN
jgi:hypothetical protein